MTQPTVELPHLLFGGQDRLKGAFPPELLSPSYRAEIAGFPVMDAGAHAAFGAAFYTAFPDLGHTFEEVRRTDDGFVVRFTLRGTNLGSFMGAPATNRTVSVSAVILLTVEHGKVTWLRGMFDQLGLLRQLGFVPA